MRRNVITFTLPNEGGREISLCGTHDETHPHLGQVTHGQHWGHCEDCETEAEAREQEG